MKNLLRSLCGILCICALLITPAAALSVEDALYFLEHEYVNDIPPVAYDAQTLDELFSALDDPYTYYMDQEAYQAFLTEVEGDGSVSGIGALVSCRENGILIESVLDDSGAEKVGLAAGDLIVAINGESCVPADETHRVQLLGEEGSSVLVTVRHPNGSVEDYSVTRRRISLHNTTFSVQDSIGHIDCDTFGTQTGTYFCDGIKQYDDQVRLWTVDLRGNGGGLTDSAIEALGAFVGSGNLLYYKSHYGYIFQSIHQHDDLTDKPVIILTDGQSASSSEIFAGDMVCRKAGIVIGSRTYGKGVAQVIYDDTVSPLFDGDALKITAYRFYLDNGSTTDRIGVIPTLCTGNAMAADVAALLCGQKPTDSSSYLRLVLNGLDFYVNLSEKSTHPDALQTLLSALAPDAVLFWGQGGSERMVAVSEARALCGFSPLGRDFTDVAKSAYADKINALSAYCLVFGDGNGKFRPADTMTRAEVCALLAQALNITSLSDGYFTDVPAGSWYSGSINAMAALGLVNGVGNGQFAPLGTMTQEEFLTIMGRLAEFLNLNVCAYLDGHPLGILEPLPCYASYSPWAIRCVDLLANFRSGEQSDTGMLFTGLENISPKAPISREQAAAVMYHVLTMLGILVY